MKQQKYFMEKKASKKAEKTAKDTFDEGLRFWFT